MKTKLMALVILAAVALPAFAQDPVVLTPTKLYDLIEQLQKRASGAAERDKLHEQKIAALEKKVTHITRILKLKQEQGK